MTNPVLEAIFSRRSVRAYTDERVDDEAVQLLAKVALAAPSAVNAQPWRVIAVQDKELILELERAVVDYFVKVDDSAVVERNKSRGNKIFYNASTVFFLPMKENANTDIGIVAQNIAIAATSMGLGSTILGLPRVAFQDPDTAGFWKRKIGFPEHFVYGLAVAVGYPAGEGKPHELDMEKLSYVK